MKKLSVLFCLLFPALLGAQEIPEDFISFSVPGYEKQMEQIRAIYYEAYMNPAARPGPSFWDVWTPVPLMSVAPIKADMDSLWIHAMLSRSIDAHGYVSSHQHFSHALDNGWPFPLFPQFQEGFEGSSFGYLFQDSPDDVTGMLSGWRGLLYDRGYLGARAAARWTLHGLRSGGIVDDAWELTVTENAPSIETEDGFLIDAFCCPFISFRAEWDTDAPLQGVMEWRREGEETLGGKSQRLVFDLQQPDPFHGSRVRYCTLEPYTEKGWSGKITKLRFTFPNAPGSKIRLQAIFSAFDTRHQMNACNFLIGSIHTFNQTGDEAFLRKNIGRMRKVFSYAQKELYDRKAGMIRVRYPGHDGLPGFERDESGRKVYNYGHSIGGNYWDILPFGNLETYTSYYYVYMLRMMADLEEYIRSSETLGVPSGGPRLRPRALRREADRIAATLNRRLWNEKDGRFYGSEDVEGNKWDYGFTFLNEEAIYYGAATPGHARTIMDWIDGRRIVEGDTSTGADIYRWRLAPRATTRRNDSWYFWGWEPDVFPFGRQVQDGGAVFSQSFNDMMSRILVYGPDNAWKRFEGILDWYADTRAAGGYRAYYESGAHGNSMQGSGTAGGIGIDMEFAETLLVPFTMVEGFLGFKATPEGFTINPRLPSEWKSLTVNNLRFRGQMLSITADAYGITVLTEGKPLCGVVSLPEGYTYASGRSLGGGRWSVAPAEGEAWPRVYRFPAAPADGPSCTAPGEVLPIMAWHSMPPSEFTLERFQELADAGFNINFSFVGSLDDARRELDLGGQTGVKIMLTCSDLLTKTDSVVRIVRDHPALYGYFLKDEPWCTEFPGLGEWADRIKAADPDHVLYLNLYPSAVNMPSIGAKDYHDYVRRFVEEVKLPLISFDCYPIVHEGVRQWWYENLEIIREEAQAAGLPFWAFSLATAHWTYPLPTMAHMRLQMYTNLAYGAAGLQYFTYWNPTTQTFDFNHAPIDLEGKRTFVYDLVKELNHELQARAGVFVGAENRWVRHVGDSIPPATARLEELPEEVVSLDTHGAGAVVSLLEKGSARYLMLVSRSIDDPMQVDVAFRRKASLVDRNGIFVPVGRHPETMTVEPGDALIFRISK